MAKKEDAAAPAAALAAAPEALTIETVKQMIAEAVAGLVTVEQVKTLIAESQAEMFEMVNASTLATITSDGPALSASLDPAWLEGLLFRGAKQEKKLVDGRPRLVGKPYTRPLIPEDVLSYLVNGDLVTIIAGDGQKHVVEI